VLTAGAELALGKHELALGQLVAVQRDMADNPVIHDWYCRLILQWILTDLWLVKGDLARAREEGEAFLAITGATAERTWQALAWESNARIALASLNLQRAQECITDGLSTIEGFEVPLAAWRVHSTAAELSTRRGQRAAASHHRERSRATVLALAGSLPAEDPIRARFLSTRSVSSILG